MTIKKHRRTKLEVELDRENKAKKKEFVQRYLKKFRGARQLEVKAIITDLANQYNLTYKEIEEIVDSQYAILAQCVRDDDNDLKFKSLRIRYFGAFLPLEIKYKTRSLIRLLLGTKDIKDEMYDDVKVIYSNILNDINNNYYTVEEAVNSIKMHLNPITYYKVNGKLHTLDIFKNNNLKKDE